MRFLTVFYVLLVSLSAFAVDMTPEEQTIRTAYAKLSYAVDLETAIGAVKPIRKSPTPNLLKTWPREA
jgi:hypothetical protein